MNYEAVRDGIQWAFGQAGSIAQEQVIAVAQELMRPSVTMRPRVYPDGDQWCALYGDDIQMGVAGFGASPALACADFDAAWHKVRKEER